MSRNNTGNPLGSKAFLDFEDNVKNLDEAVNGTESAWVDRLGRYRKSFEGMEREFDSAQSSREAVFSDFLQGSGYQDLGEYAPGIEITAHNQYVTFGGQPYLLKPSIPVPYTTSGGWTGADFKLIGDDSLRQDLANPDKGAAMVARGVVAVDSIADLLSLPEGQRKEGLRYLVKGYHAGSDTGGGQFYYDGDRSSENDGGTVLNGFVRAFAGTPTFEMFGAKGDGVSDDHTAINSAIAAYRRVNGRPNATYRVSDSIRPRSKSYLDFSNAEIVSSLPVVLVRMDNCLYATIRNAKLDVPEGGAGIVIDSPDSGASVSQFNRFYDIDIECNGRLNTKALHLGKCWCNQFHSCNFMRSAVGAQFGSDLLPDNHCNANHFYGCEVRSVNTLGGTAVVHYGGDNNAFFGGIIENWEFGAVIHGGSFLLSGVYLEAFSAGRGFQMHGGQFTIRDCFNNYATDIHGGRSFRFEGHHFIESAWDTGSAYHSGYPGIAMRADADTRVTVDVAIPPDKSFVIREGECLVDGVWQKRTVGYEDIRWVAPKFSARLAADRLGVTGDGTSYQVNYGNGKEFVRPAGVLDNTGVFTAPVFGTYRLAGQLWLSGLTDGDIINVRVASSNRNYYGHLDRVVGGQFSGSGNNYLVKFDCFAEMEAGDTARVFVIVSGQSARSVSVIRGDAVNGYTTFIGFKV